MAYFTYSIFDGDPRDAGVHVEVEHAEIDADGVDDAFDVALEHAATLGAAVAPGRRMYVRVWGPDESEAGTRSTPAIAPQG